MLIIRIKINAPVYMNVKFSNADQLEENGYYPTIMS